MDLGNASPSQPRGIFPRCWDAPSFLTTPPPRPRSSNAAYHTHTAWFIFRKLDPTSKRKRGMGGHSYTCYPNRALKQEPLEIINPRSGRSLLSRMDSCPPPPTNYPAYQTQEIRPAAFVPHLPPRFSRNSPSFRTTKSRYYGHYSVLAAKVLN